MTIIYPGDTVYHCDGDVYDTLIHPSKPDLLIAVCRTHHHCATITRDGVYADWPTDSPTFTTNNPAVREAYLELDIAIREMIQHTAINQKITAIRAIRALIPGTLLTDAKNLVENPPHAPL